MTAQTPNVFMFYTRRRRAPYVPWRGRGALSWRNPRCTTYGGIIGTGIASTGRSRKSRRSPLVDTQTAASPAVGLNDSPLCISRPAHARRGRPLNRFDHSASSQKTRHCQPPLRARRISNLSSINRGAAGELGLHGGRYMMGSMTRRPLRPASAIDAKPAWVVGGSASTATSRRARFSSVPPRRLRSSASWLATSEAHASPLQAFQGVHTNLYPRCYLSQA